MRRMLCGAMFVMAICGMHSAESRDVPAGDDTRYRLADCHLLDFPWNTTTIYRESIVPAHSAGNGPATARLAFPAVELVKIRAADGSRILSAGIDFDLGKDRQTIEFAADTTIPAIDMGKRFVPVGSPDSYPHRVDHPEQGLMYHPGKWFHTRQFEVTYRRANAGWVESPPAVAEKELPQTLRRLRDGRPLSIVVAGDSIAAGGDASIHSNVAPRMPAFPELVADQLAETYDSAITLKNLAVGGTSIRDGVAAAEKYMAEKPDLLIVAFGMNDVGRRDPAWFEAETRKLIDAVRAARPEIEILLVAPMLGNAEWVHTPPEVFPKYRDVLAGFVDPGIALADLTAVWELQMRHKHHYDLTGNGLNHPNDYGHRLYAQTVLARLVPASAAEGGAAENLSVCDVLVYGATPAGFCAAVGAAREGAAVILLEPTSHVGGVNTGGLCFSDSNQTVRTALGGLFEEWHLRIEADYARRGVKLPYAVAVKDHSHWTYEPHVAARITHQLLAEAGVRVVTADPIVDVDVQDRAIAEIVTESGGRLQAKSFVDATYEGDLMAKAGVSWVIGREGRSEYDEDLAGKRYPKPAMPISGFADDGSLLPLVTTTDAGPDDAGDGNVMTYSFRLCLTDDPENRVPFPAPADYDPQRFEVVRRYLAVEKRPVLLWDLYRLPGGKVDANNGIGKQFSMGLVGHGNGWCEATHTERRRIYEEYKQYTLELYHFLTTDPTVPESLRTKLAAYGLCRDEFPENGHWSPQLYVREGRRMRGMYVLTQRDVLTDREKPDSIAVSSFPIDSHDCQRIARLGGEVVNEGTIFPVRMPGRGHGPPSQIPYRAILPKPDECTNLLVPVALSASHVAFSSVRVEPTWMTIGHSAGIAAALVAARGGDVQQLPYDELRIRLIGQNQILDLPELPPLPDPPPILPGIEPASLPGLVLDDADAELTGDWSLSSTFRPYLGSGYRHDGRSGDGGSIATFRFMVPETGRYEIRMAYSPHETRATNVPLVAMSGSQTTQLHIDQTQPLPEGQVFRPIGVVELTGGIESTLQISNTGADGFVILDGLQLVLDTADD